MNDVVSKKIQITLPDRIYDALVRWAQQDGRPLANLAGWIVETKTEAELETGRIPPKNPSEAHQTKGDNAIRSVLRKIAQGEQPSPEEVEIAAAELDVDSNELMHRAKKAKEGTGVDTNY